jgi:hypothetical protein
VVDGDLAIRLQRRRRADVIRIQHESLPTGLSAVVRRRPGGDTDVVVSTDLGPARQRAAVRVGLQAARSAGRRTALPVPLVGVLALAWASARAIARGIRVHPAALVAAAGAVAAAAVVIAVVPHQHSTTGGSHPGAGGVPAPASAAARPAGQPARSAQPEPHPTSAPTSTVVPVADRSLAASGGGSAPAPGASAVGPGASQPPPSAAPQPSPSSSAGHGGLCVELLGLRVCV